MTILKKINILVILFSIFFSVNSYSEIVKKVEIKGNDRISKETIIIFGDVKIGDNYEESDISGLIKKLYDTSFFSDISVELSNSKLIIIVEENPIVEEVVFEGVKSDKYKDKIKELISVRENTSYMSNNVKRDINTIKSFYRNQGYYFVNIDVEIEKLEKNNLNIIYSIEQGEKAKISKIYFLGDKKYRDKKLRDIITSEESKFWKFLSRNVYLNEGRIELDKRLLKNYYRNKGYYEVNIASSSVEYSEGEGFVLTYSIESGKRYIFKKIFADVSKSLDSAAFLSLEPEFNKLAGGYYSQKKLNSVLEKIDQLSEQKELQFINHSVLETLDGNGVEVKINIFEGQKFIVEKINISGNTVTNDSVIRGELLVDEGDPYSELLVNKSINKIRGRNIFGNVTRKTLPGSTDDLKVLEINVEEKATGEIMAGAGIGTEGTSFMFTVRENNWLGKGVSLETAINISEEKIKGNIAITDPNYNFSGNALSTALDVSSLDRTEISGFKSSTTGASIGTNFEQYEDIYFSPSIDIKHENIETESTASDSIKKMDGDYFTSNFQYGITLDKRNQSWQPTEGYATSFYQKLPLILDSSSISNNFNASLYNEFSEDVIGSLKFQFRAINGVDEDVRLSERQYVSSKRLRGFVRGKVGPKDGTDWVGGNYVSGMSAEAQLPNLLPESYKTDFGVFFDTANVWGVDYDNSIDNSNKIRSSVGFAANMFTPVGPLSWTISQAITKASTDQTETFNFNIGTSF